MLIHWIFKSTEKVCVPIDPNKCEEFNPNDVPTVDLLIREVDDWEKKQQSNLADNMSMKDYRKTSLSPYIRLFNTSFLLPLEHAARRTSER